MESEENNSNVILGFLPLGSGCDFVRTLGMDSNQIDKNIDTLFECYTIPSDIGLCEAIDFDKKKEVSKYFINISSFGASGAIMKNVNSSSMIINHEITYTYHVLMTSLFTQNSKIYLGDKEMKIYIVSVCNGQYYGNNLWVNPKGNITDSKFDVIVIGDMSFYEIVKALSDIRTGDHLVLDKVHQEESKEIVTAQPDQNEDIIIECDGELTGILPAKWTMKPQALKIIVPKGFKYKKK